MKNVRKSSIFDRDYPIRFDGNQPKFKIFSVIWFKMCWMYLGYHILNDFFQKKDKFFLTSVLGQTEKTWKKRFKKRIFSLFIGSIKRICSKSGHGLILGRFARAKISEIWWLFFWFWPQSSVGLRANTFTNFWDTP